MCEIIAQLMLPKCKFMFDLCDVFGGFEVLGSAAVYFVNVSTGVSVSLCYFYLTAIPVL